MMTTESFLSLHFFNSKAQTRQKLLYTENNVCKKRRKTVYEIIACKINNNRTFEDEWQVLSHSRFLVFSAEANECSSEQCNVCPHVLIDLLN